MKEEIRRLQREAERIASKRPLPEFYIRFKAPLAQARKLFFTHPLVLHLRRQVEPLLHEDLGHGSYHCKHVSLDSAAIIHMELELSPIQPARLERLMVLGQFAGLLHDICRNEKEHAEAGAREAEKILENYPLSQEEVLCICQAIRNHEAFTTPIPCSQHWSQLISDCLYDADKFRWGPDNFTHTIWHMVNHRGVTVPELIESFPWGMSGILRIQETFRTSIGRQYGPDIIETGVAVGKEVYRHLIQRYAEEPGEE